jgi:4-aminobutyrate aminotransferase-like enzyme
MTDVFVSLFDVPETRDPRDRRVVVRWAACCKVVVHVIEGSRFRLRPRLFWCVDTMESSAHRADVAAALVVGALVGYHWPQICRSVASWTRREDESSKARTLNRRLQYFCDAQSISYRNTDPLMAMKMSMQYVYDDQGQAYLDTRNNVGHVGWSHPHVVRAVQAQTALCNSNSRYLHPKRTALAEKLLSHFPEELSVVFFVNSGSEANDLALRLARAHTGNHGAVVVDHAYHGHTVATMSLSPYKYEHVGGEAYQVPWVKKAMCPCMYRGQHRDLPVREAAEAYAEDVRRACAESEDGKVAAFFIESGMSVAGVILPPPGYLAACYQHVRAAGGVCVADEVQTGFGRFGESFWGFEQQRVVPDIVTVGKPFGNGFPLAAVVTTPAIARSFTNGLEYFNTFGGNPVACAAGLAVLETIEREGLQEHAKNIGRHFYRKVRSIMADPSSPASRFFGDIRGSGLFLGIELVKSQDTRDPATMETSILCSRLKAEHKILTSIDGPMNNVLVIKPPMCFSIADADRLLDAMVTILPTIDAAATSAYVHTPT